MVLVSRARDDIGKQFENDTSLFLAANADFKKTITQKSELRQS